MPIQNQDGTTAPADSGNATYDTYRIQANDTVGHYLENLWHRNPGLRTQYPAVNGEIPLWGPRGMVVDFVRYNNSIPAGERPEGWQYIRAANGRDCDGRPENSPHINEGKTFVYRDQPNEILNPGKPCATIEEVPEEVIVNEVVEVTPPEPVRPETPPRTFNAVGQPEFYQRQPTVAGDSPTGLINAFETIAATGRHSSMFDPGDIAARPYVGSFRTGETGLNGDYHRQGRQSAIFGDQPVAENPSAPSSRQPRDGRQGTFYLGNLFDGDRNTDRSVAQEAFLNGEGFRGNNERNFVRSERGPGFTFQPRESMQIGQPLTTTSGAQMPTYTVSVQDLVGRDIWFRDNPTQTTGPIMTYDQALAYEDYQIISEQLRPALASVNARLAANDTTLTTADVQSVLDMGNYAQRNFLVRSAGMHLDVQTVLNDVSSRATALGVTGLNTRDGTSQAILDVPVAELGGNRMRVMSAERREELEDRWGHRRFDGYEGMEGREFGAGVYDVINRRMNYFDQEIANHRATLVRQTPEQIAQTTSTGLGALLNNGASVAALGQVAAGRDEVATALGGTFARAYNNPELFGMSQGEVTDIIRRVTPGSREANNEVTDGQRTGYIPNTPISGVPFFADSRGILRDPNLFASAVAASTANDPQLQADVARLLQAAPAADRVLILQSLTSDPRVNASGEIPLGMQTVLNAANLDAAGTQAVLNAGVQSAVYNHSSYTGVEVSARGHLDDWLVTMRAWQENGQPGALPTLAMSPAELEAARASGALTPEMDALLASNNANATGQATAPRVYGVSDGDLSLTRSYLTGNNTEGATWDLFYGQQSQASGTAAVIAESMRFNPALANNLIISTMRREPGSFANVVTALRERAEEYNGTGRFGIGNASRFDDAANALERTATRVNAIDEATWAAAARGEPRATRTVENAYKDWNQFMDGMVNRPTSNDAHLRYAAFEEVFDAVGRDPVARGQMLDTVYQDPQLREAAIEMLRLTPMQRENMVESTLIGRGNADRQRSIPQAVSGAAIDAASTRYAAFTAEDNGRIRMVTNVAAISAVPGSVAATAAAAQPTVGDATIAGAPLAAVNAGQAADGSVVAAGAAGSTPAGADAVTAGTTSGVTAGAGSVPAGTAAVTAGAAGSTPAGADAVTAGTTSGVTAGAGNVPAGTAAVTAGAAGSTPAGVDAITAGTTGGVTAGGDSITAGIPAGVIAAAASGAITSGVIVSADLTSVTAATAVLGGTNNGIEAGTSTFTGTVPGVPGIDWKWVIPRKPDEPFNPDTNVVQPPNCPGVPGLPGQEVCIPGT